MCCQAGGNDYVGVTYKSRCALVKAFGAAPGPPGLLPLTLKEPHVFVPDTP